MQSNVDNVLISSSEQWDMTKSWNQSWHILLAIKDNLFLIEMPKHTKKNGRCNYSHPTGVVNRFTGRTFPLQIKLTLIFIKCK